MELRKNGENNAAYELLSEATKRAYSKELFDSYCFTFRVIDFEVSKEKSPYFLLSYNFYDKRYKKDSKELYTFYISSNSESVKVLNQKIVFPYPGILEIRENIEEKNSAELKKAALKMLSIDPENVDIIEMAKKMELYPEKKNE